MRPSWLSAAVVAAASADCSSARSAATSCIARTARWPSSGPIRTRPTHRPNPDRHREYLMNAPLDHPPIVVGVDASPTSEPALRWAITEASTRRIPLKLVSAWNPNFDIDALGLATREVEDHCRAVLDHAREQVDATDPTIPVTTTTYIGPAQTALIAASRDADTVVVGSR